MSGLWCQASLEADTCKEKYILYSALCQKSPVCITREHAMKHDIKQPLQLVSAILVSCTIATGVCAQPGGDHYPHEPDRHLEGGPPGYSKPYIIRRDHVVVVPEKRVRRYRDVVILRPYGHWYPGYGHYHSDSDAFKWLAFTAITLKILDNLNEAQERALEQAQIKATTAPIGESIIWREGAASGSVTATREGTSTAGRYCREFQQKVIVGGHTQEAYGTACMQPDGSWEVVSTGQ
jgi:hypothetical protein